MSPRIGMLVTYLDAEPKYTFEDLYAYDSPLDVHVVEQTLMKVSDRAFISSRLGATAPSEAELTSKIEIVLDYLRCLADVVILDLPCTFDEDYFQVLGLANKVVLVGEQRIPSVRNLQLILSTLKGKGGEARCLLAANRYDPDMEGFTTRDLAKLLHTPHIMTLANAPRTDDCCPEPGETDPPIFPSFGCRGRRRCVGSSANRFTTNFGAAGKVPECIRKVLSRLRARLRERTW